MTLARMAHAVRGNTADVLVGWELVEKIRQHWSVADTAGRHFNAPYLQCFFIDPSMYLAPEAAFGSTVFARIPFAFALSFHTCAVNEKV